MCPTGHDSSADHHVQGRHGLTDDANRVDHAAVLCRHVYYYGGPGTTRTDQLDWQADGTFDYVRGRELSAGSGDYFDFVDFWAVLIACGLDSGDVDDAASGGFVGPELVVESPVESIGVGARLWSVSWRKWNVGWCQCQRGLCWNCRAAWVQDILYRIFQVRWMLSLFDDLANDLISFSGLVSL